MHHFLMLKPVESPFDGCAAKAQKGQGIGGSRAAQALGAERGWRQRCPVDVGATQGGRWGFHMISPSKNGGFLTF